MLRRFSILVIALSFLSSSSAQAWTRTPPPSGEPHWGIENRAISMSYIYNVNATLLSMKSESYKWDEAKVKKVSRCKSFPTDECSVSEYQSYSAPLGSCKDFKTDCVEEVYAEVGGKKVDVNFVKYFPESSIGDFVGNPVFNLPTPGQSFLVSIPEAKHENGDLYLVAAFLWGQRFPNESNKFQTRDAEFAVFPVHLVSGQFEMAHVLMDISTYNGLSPTGVGGSCLGEGIQNTETQCAILDKYPADVVFGMKLRLSTTTRSWFHGRISDVEVKVDQTSNNELFLDVKGRPVTTPIVFGWVKKSEISDALRNYYNSLNPSELLGGSGYGCISGKLGPCNPNEWVSSLRTADNSEKGMRELAAWLPILKDTAAASESTWFLRSMDAYIPDQCLSLQNQFLGTVSTNAVSYLPGAPEFNQNTQTLDYKILAPHYLEDGSVFKGTYDLVINSKLARCIYNFDSAPVSASVTLVTENGENQVATAVTTEKDGFLRVSVKGFTFSNPTLRVKLEQARQNSAIGANRASTSSSTSAGEKSIRCFSASKSYVVTGRNPTCPKGLSFVVEKTITCKKGSSVKKVTGEQPDCPRGYLKISTSTPKFPAKSGIKSRWCLQGNVAIQVAGIKPKCPPGMSSV